jgi:hypothetical protein
MSSQPNFYNGASNYTFHFDFGIHSLAAAILFAVLYVPLFGWNLYQSVAQPKHPYVRQKSIFVILAVFCALRIAAFVTRAVLAASGSARENLRLVIVNQVLYGAGFFGLMYSAYTLVLDR